MSDPLSVAASAVGIISLGLQVCKEIVSYCEAWRGYDEDIQRIATKAHELRLPLQQLRALIEDPRLDDPDILKDLEGKAFNLQTTVVKLQKTIDKFKPALSDSVPDKIRAQLKKASYPFRKDTLREIENDLQGMQIDLQTTLDIYSVQKITEIGTVSETILGIVEEMRLVLCNSSPKDLPSPGLLRSCCDRQREWEQLITRNQSRSPASPAMRTYRHYSRLLGFTFTASFWRPTGAGGFSIAPPLLNVKQVLDLGAWPWYLVADFRIYLEHSNAEDYGKSLFAWFQQEFDKKNYKPTCDFLHESEAISVIDILTWGGDYRATRVLLELGAVPKSNYSFGAFYEVLASPYFGEAEYSLISEFVKRGGPIEFFDPGCFFKQNLRYILSRDDEFVAFPEIVKILIRESEDELRHTLDSPKAPVHDTFLGTHRILVIAFGWPQGVQMLLDRGSTLDGSENEDLQMALTEMGDDFPGLDGYYESSKLLISAGWQWYDLGYWDLMGCQSKKLRSLFINDLVAQRRTLWRQAQQFLPTDELPILEEGSVLDVDASRVYAALVAQGRRIDPRLGPNRHGISVYHMSFCHSQILDEVYKAGFRDVDSADPHGRTPIMHQLHNWSMSPEDISWFVAKGADPFRRLPRSSATATHLLSQRLMKKYGDRDVPLHKIDKFSNFCGQFLFSAIQDGCVCACSPGGCSILTVALRCGLELLGEKRYDKRNLSRLLRNLIYLHKSTFGVDETIIRLLTFDGLGVKHTCCVNDYQDGYGFPLATRDWKEVEEIQDEEKPLLKILEELVAEFEAKHAELGLPILEFLEKHWHPRMLEHLSQRDPYNEKHHRECKELGVFLEAEGDDIPDRVSLSIGPRLVEVQDQT